MEKFQGSGVFTIGPCLPFELRKISHMAKNATLEKLLHLFCVFLRNITCKCAGKSLKLLLSDVRF